MARIILPNKSEITDLNNIKQFLQDRNIVFEEWKAKYPVSPKDSQEEILEAYKHQLEPFMKKNGYSTADVIFISSETNEYGTLRAKFLAEHTHTEDEVRFFVAGKGLFWFHLNKEIFAVECDAGKLISVPEGVPHWFDAGKEHPFVVAIRLFSNTSGWQPHYTEEKAHLPYTHIHLP
ncbi:MAG: 1,2-dihydroxy-3-keto-5-methylthiopentene dioxygenase [Luteibaculum sp.]